MKKYEPIGYYVFIADSKCKNGNSFGKKYTDR